MFPNTLIKNQSWNVLIRPSTFKIIGICKTVHNTNDTNKYIPGRFIPDINSFSGSSVILFGLAISNFLFDVPVTTKNYYDRHLS